MCVRVICQYCDDLENEYIILSSQCMPRDRLRILSMTLILKEKTTGFMLTIFGTTSFNREMAITSSRIPVRIDLPFLYSLVRCLFI